MHTRPSTPRRGVRQFVLLTRKKKHPPKGVRHCVTLTGGLLSQCIKRRRGVQTYAQTLHTDQAQQVD